MFDNFKVKGVHYSRYIMSWVRSGGTFNNHDDYIRFRRWLKTFALPDYDINNIMDLAESGKLELEESAKLFMLSQIFNN